MSRYLNLFRLGHINDNRDPEIVGYFHVVQDVREVEHEGYCSEAGEDTGVWQYDKKRTFHLNEHAYNIMLRHIDPDTEEIKMEILDKLFPAKVPCGYCGYESDYVNKGGYLIYVKDFNIWEETRLKAYYIAEKDNFSKSPETYWFQAEAYVKRKGLLKKALLAKKMILRNDSKMCEKWMSGEIEHTLEDVVRTMVECEWCIRYQNMFAKIREYKKLPEAEGLNNEEIFSIVKKHILDGNPVPEFLPWI